MEIVDVFALYRSISAFEQRAEAYAGRIGNLLTNVNRKTSEITTGQTGADEKSTYDTSADD